MPFSFRIQLFAVIQVILTALFTYIFVTNEYRDLSEQNVATLEAFLIEQKQQELKNYTEIAKASIQHIYAGAAKDDPVAQELVANILSTLIYDGHDGYFFVYDEYGTNIVLPTEPYRVGQNYWDLLNDKGEP
ncbi:MAG: cache domain-containing protein, partial [Glaciecola sp.]